MNSNVNREKMSEVRVGLGIVDGKHGKMKLTHSFKNKSNNSKRKTLRDKRG